MALGIRAWSDYGIAVVGAASAVTGCEPYPRYS
jgi:hypothetical protein